MPATSPSVRSAVAEQYLTDVAGLFPHTGGPTALEAVTTCPVCRVESTCLVGSGRWSRRIGVDQASVAIKTTYIPENGYPVDGVKSSIVHD